MEIVVQILKHLPAGWPRIVVLIGIGLLFFFPELRRLLAKRQQDKERLERVKQLLELRKLELTVVDLKAKYPDAQNTHIDSQIEELLSEPQPLSEPTPELQKAEPLAWIDRFKFSLAGSFALMIIGGIALWLSGRFLGGDDAVKVILIELGLTVLCGLLASAIPCRSRWECIFRGFVIPALLGALTVAAKGNT
jgi:hypothetical protein